jgi:hypothetical protein
MKCNYGVAELLTPGQAGGEPFDPALRGLRMNRAAARFTSSAPTDSEQVWRGWAGPSCGGHGVPCPYDGKGWRSEDRGYEFKNRLQLLPGSMNLNRPLQIQKQRQIQLQRQRRPPKKQEQAAATNSKANSTTTRLPFEMLIFRGRRRLGRRSLVGQRLRCDRGILRRGIRCRRRLGRICRI